MAAEQTTIRAKFDSLGDLEKALESLQSRGLEAYEAYGPVNLEELASLMPPSRSRSNVRFWATIAAIIPGLIGFYMMCRLTSLLFNLIVGGKLAISNVPYVVVAYEGTILLGAVAAFVAVLWYIRPMVWQTRLPYDPRFGGDTFGVDVTCGPAEHDELVELLNAVGAVEVVE